MAIAIIIYSCAGIHGEVQNWVSPLQSNPKLQKAFLSYTKPPHTYEKLEDLSSYVSAG